MIGPASYWALSSVIVWPWILFLPYVRNLDSNLWELPAGLELTCWIQIWVYWWRQRQECTHGAFWSVNPAESVSLFSERLCLGKVRSTATEEVTQVQLLAHTPIYIHTHVHMYNIHHAHTRRKTKYKHVWVGLHNGLCWTLMPLHLLLNYLCLIITHTYRVMFGNYVHI